MFDYDYSHRLVHILDQEYDPPIDCPACYGQGKLIDFWGPMRCATCDGTGILFLSAWMAYIRTFPAEIQANMLREPLHFWTKLNGRSK